VTIAELRELARRELGPDFERATPASVRDFLDRLRVRLHEESGEGPPYVIEGEERARSYEEIVAGFFSRILDRDPEQAAVALWMLAFEQHFAMLEEDYTERYLTLFGDSESDQ
jgi:hypothetical protein